MTDGRLLVPPTFSHMVIWFIWLLVQQNKRTNKPEYYGVFAHRNPVP